MAAINNLEEHKVERIDACEALVVGAGLVGAAIAANLATGGLEVAVLEARDVASGATGHTAGLVLTGLPKSYAQVTEQHSREMAQALWQLTLDNRASLTSAADRLGVETERSGSFVLATNAEEAALLRTSAEMLRADGFEVDFAAKDPFDRGFFAAMRYREDVLVDAAALTKGLLDAHKLPVHTNTEVYRLEQDGDDVLVMARGRVVRASTVVLAVNAYAPLIDNYFADKIAPVRGHTVFTSPVDERLVTTPGNAGPFSFRQDSNGHLLFTAWPQRYETPAAGPGDVNTEIDLMRFIGRYFPEVTDQFSHRESSVMGISRDTLPLIGALPHLPQVFFAVGFAGYGLSLAFAAADLLTGLIERGAEPDLLSARRLE